MLDWLKRARRLETPAAYFGTIGVGFVVFLVLRHFGF